MSNWIVFFAITRTFMSDCKASESQKFYYFLDLRFVNKHIEKYVAPIICWESKDDG